MEFFFGDVVVVDGVFLFVVFLMMLIEVGVVVFGMYVVGEVFDLVFVVILVNVDCGIVMEE